MSDTQGIGDSNEVAKPWTPTDDLVQQVRAFLALPVCKRAIDAGQPWWNEWLEPGSSLRVGHVLMLAQRLEAHDAATGNDGHNEAAP